MNFMYNSKKIQRENFLNIFIANTFQKVSENWINSVYKDDNYLPKTNHLPKNCSVDAMSMIAVKVATATQSESLCIAFH